MHRITVATAAPSHTNPGLQPARTPAFRTKSTGPRGLRRSEHDVISTTAALLRPVDVAMETVAKLVIYMYY